MNITFYADYVCPYSYIGVTEMLRALRERGLPFGLEMRAYLLDPDAPSQNPPLISANFVQEDGGEAGAERHMAAIAKLALAGSVPLSLAGAPFASSIDAHRLTKWAAGQLAPPDMYRLMQELFADVFVRNRNIADREVLLDAASRCGLGRGAAAAMLAADYGRAEVLADTAAGDKVLEVIPFFTAGGHVLTGELTPAQIGSFLDALGREDAAESTGGAVC